jgi:hypothetical protein
MLPFLTPEQKKNIYSSGNICKRIKCGNRSNKYHTLKNKINISLNKSLKGEKIKEDYSYKHNKLKGLIFLW